MNTDKQENKQERPWMVPYQFKKGQSGNPAGRPKGKTLKEWAREKLFDMDDEERVEFLKRVPAELIWRLAEGNPHSTTDETVTHVIPTPIMRLTSVDKPVIEGVEEAKAVDSGTPKV